MFFLRNYLIVNDFKQKSRHVSSKTITFAKSLDFFFLLQGLSPGPVADLWLACLRDAGSTPHVWIVCLIVLPVGILFLGLIHTFVQLEGSFRSAAFQFWVHTHVAVVNIQNCVDFSSSLMFPVIFFSNFCPNTSYMFFLHASIFESED